RADYGGWRYLHAFTNVEADLSVVGWHLKLLRSAKNSGFNVPQRAIDDAVRYVLNCFNPGYQTFEYDTSNDDRRTRAMAGVGILALAHSSRHERREALAAADFILREGFTDYNQFHRYTYHSHYSDRYHYGVFMCTMAMYQIGGRHWSQFYPPTVRVLLANQQPTGAWPPESNHDAHFGQTYTTSLVELALSAPNQLLPIYQR
ncbi:MAG: terpene cyclase/mutase family protein, partial [Planctomycetales bacterium]|nr:terpene cyclase/mutase family protein [Planctomycetales bacterium]